MVAFVLTLAGRLKGEMTEKEQGNYTQRRLGAGSLLQGACSQCGGFRHEAQVSSAKPLRGLEKLVADEHCKLSACSVTLIGLPAASP